MPEPRYRALLIGNAVFPRDPLGLPRLQGPRADVDALHEALADAASGMFTPQDISMQIDRPLQGLREEVYRFLITEATRDDVLLLYYSGHGKLDIEGRLHLCTNDTLLSALPVTALQYREHIDALIKQSPAASVVTILDCCHSGAFRGGELKVKANGKGRCVITSASANELALDALGPGGTSPFTNALVAGLRFARADPHLTAQGLYDYVETELGPAGHSRPQFYFDGEGAIALARRQSQAPLPATSAIPETPAEEPETLDTAEQLDDEPLRYPKVFSEVLTGLDLPEPRTHLWKLLNEAALSALADDDEEDEDDKRNGLREVVETAVGLDERWPRAVLKRLAEGRDKQACVEAMAAGLAKRDPQQALEFAEEFAQGSPEYTGAHLSIATALSGIAPVLAHRSLRNAFDHFTDRYGEREVLLAVRLLEIHGYASGRDPDDADAAIAQVARDRKNWNPQHWDSLAPRLNAYLRQERLPELRTPAHALVALRLAIFNPEAARDFFVIEGHFLPEPSFAQVPIANIVRGAGSMLGFDPPTGHRLLEIAERRCRTEEDWIELFDTLIEALQDAPGPPAMADHLVTSVERAIDHIPDEECWQLRSAAVSLAATAPAAAGRLLRFDPDEDRMRAGLIEVAREAASVDAVAARPIAAAAERLVLSILDETEQANEVELAQAFAAIDPDHAMRVLRSVPDENYRQTLALTKVAAAFTKSHPERIEPLISEFASGDRSDSRMGHIYEGVAEVDPARAMQLAASMRDSPYKDSVIAEAAERIAANAPAEAAEIAVGLSDEFKRAHTLNAIVRTIAADHPDRAAVLARQIPTEPSCAYARATALSTASRALAPDRPDQAEYLLSLAERAAGAMDDGHLKGSVLCGIAGSYIAIGLVSLRASKLLAQAEQCAETATDEERRVALLYDIMVAWAAIAPKHAERLAAALPEHWNRRDWRLREAAIAMAPGDPRRAEQFASKIGERWEHLRALEAMVEEFCESAPARAERLALAMEPGVYRTEALLKVAEATKRRQSW
jgi:hypothetical protein